jgi:L-lactate utilization protein LutC
MNSRDEFLQNVRRALGRETTPGSVEPNHDTAFFLEPESVESLADLIRQDAKANADKLMAQAEESAKQAGWHVVRVATASEASEYIAKLARDLEARSVLRSAHTILDGLKLDESFDRTGIEFGVMAIGDTIDEAERDSRRQELREQAINADIGITGVDYVIAETGSCVLFAGKGVSRVVSLLPPVHVAVVEKGQVLPSLDELFTVRRHDFLNGSLGSYMNLITGPSRTADIEYTIVTGVHGPGEVHMVMIG